MSSAPKVFFGWYIVAAASVGLVMGLSTFIGVSFGIFLKPLSEEFDWSRAEVSFALTLATFVIIICAPLVGKLMDRVGVRRLLLPGIGAFGLAVCGLYFINGSLYQFYAAFVMIALVGVVTLPASYTRVILNWFDRKRGIALGLALSGVGIGAVLMPLLIQFLIANWGWREAYLAIGLAAIVVCLPVVALLLRERPADMGLVIDGGEFSNKHKNAKTASPPGGLSLRESMRERSFWLLTVTFLLMGLATIGTVAHLMPLLTDRGIPPTHAAATISLLGIALIAGRIFCGYLVDRFFAPYVAFVFLAGAALGLVIIAGGAEGPITLFAVALLGLGFGAEFDLMSYLISRYLGLRSYGQLYGIIYAVFSAGAGVGPLLMGRIYDVSGSYATGLYLFAVCGIVAALLVLFLGPYRSFSAEI